LISQLPKWIEYGAFILAFVAGCINAIGLLGFEHQSVSHLSGTATLFGTSITQTDFSSSLHLAGILLTFFLGASLSGFLLHGTKLELGRHYDSALFVESGLILLSFYLLSNGNFYGHYAASAACGLQNALATTYSGAIIRTTHLTGIFTDLGIMLGSFIRGEQFDRRKALLFALIILGFISGGAAGAVLFEALRFSALIMPACICFALAVVYRIYYLRKR
jgi:uncharacterized membrane protein YoaK (UPF0700 family)